MASIVSLAWQRYLRQLHESPLATKATTSAVIAALADVLAQRLSNSKLPVNWRRAAILGLYGLLWIGPSNHYWHSWLERNVAWGTQSISWRAIKKVCVDQLTYGPLNNILMIFFIAKIVEGRSWNATRTRLYYSYPSVQLKGWSLWPAAQWLNHRFIPLNLRVLWSNGVALVWQCFMIMKAREVKKKVQAPLLKTHAH